MIIGAFEIHEPVPQHRDPHALIMVRPWVDVGSVATITLARLENHFKAKELGKLARPGNFFDFTRYRPTLRLVKGRREVAMPNSVIKYAQTQDGLDFLFFHLLEPHAFAEDYTDSVLEVFKFFAIKRYCRLGAMYDAVPHTRPILVTGDPGGALKNKNAGTFRQRQSTYQGPTTIMNLVSDGVPRLELGADIMNFMVHLPQYLQLEEDFAGAASLLDVLSSIYDLPPELAPTERGKRQYNDYNNAVERNPELKALITQMESHYDAQEASRDKEASPPTPLAPEVEQFLQEMNRQFGEPNQSS